MSIKTVEEWLAESHWWQERKDKYSLEETSVWAIYCDDDGMGRSPGIIAYAEGKLYDAIQYALSLGDSFYGWGHQGRLARLNVRKV